MARKTLYIQPTKAAITAANKGLEARKKAPKSKKGGLDTQQAKAEGVGSGVARARDIIAGKKVNAYQVKAFFDRHRQNYLNAKMKGLKPEESRAIQAWLIWGGEPLRKQAEREVAKHEKGLTNKNPPKKAKKKAMARKKNPFETQQKARFISDGIWFYRGYEIQTKRRTSKSGKKKGFSVIFEQVMTSPSCPPVKDHHPWLEQFTGFIVPDETAAIAMARIIIDKSCYHATLTGDDYQNFINMDYALADAVYMSSGPDGKAKVTRSNVTRRLEQKCGRPAAAKVYQQGYAFFNSLPIKDRIAWVDSEIRLFNLQEGRPLSNPHKKKKAHKRPGPRIKKQTELPEDIEITRLPPEPDPKRSLMPGETLYWPGSMSGVTGGTRRIAPLPASHPEDPREHKNPTTAKALIANCQKLWEAYCKKPGVTKLRAVAKHCETMKASKAKSVKAERSRCMRSIRTEAKDRGWKI